MKYLVVITLSIITWGCFSKTPEKTGHEGIEIPEFKFSLQDSITQLSTADIKKGQPFIMFYFSPRCPFSRSQMKEITTNILEISNVNIYAVTPFPYSEMMGFYNNFHLNNFKNIVVGYDTSDYFGNYFMVKGFPYLAFYDKEKKLINAYMGELPINEIKKKISN